MLVPIVIIIVLVLAAASVVMFAGRARAASTGGLSRETRNRDAGSTDVVSAQGEATSSTELEAAGRARSDETRSSSFGGLVRRRRGEVVEYDPVDEEEIGVSRRQFLNRGILTAIGFGLSGFGAAMLGFLWPLQGLGGFGGTVNLGKLPDILAAIDAQQKPFYAAQARTYVVRYPKDNPKALAAAKKIYKPAIYTDMSELGIVALYQRCVHLGCRVPFCQTSQWFECPCHGSKYSRVGEKKAGPAPVVSTASTRPSRATAASSSTPATSSSARRSAPTPRTRTPRARCASDCSHPTRPDRTTSRPPFVIAAIWKNDLRHWLIWINFVVFAGLIIYVLRSVLSPKRARSEEKTPANLTPFLEDQDLEGRRLERVQGWALIFAAIFAISLPIYWLREPTRQHQSANYFDKNAVARGAVLFANSASTDYNAATSLQCANCHGQKGVGGGTSTTVNGVKVLWKVPPLNTVALRFEEDTDCLSQSRRQPNTICDITDIITYGRPGTPMQPWGVVGGGPKNDQSIADLVQYIESIQITPQQSQAAVTDALKLARADTGSCPEYMTCPGIELSNAQKALALAKTDLAKKRDAALTALGVTESDAALSTQCNGIVDQADKNATPLKGDALKQAVACGDYLSAVKTEQADQANVDWSTKWKAQRANVTDGQLLFELNCARCHTQGWSAFDPTIPPGTPNTVSSVDILGLSGGGGGNGGGIGFNLRDGDLVRRFGTDASGGFATQAAFVSNGSAPFKPYGNLGLGSGKMPGFAQVKTEAAPMLGAMLTPTQLKQIIYYERYCLDTTTYTGVTPVCDTTAGGGVGPQTPATTTSTAAKKG